MPAPNNRWGQRFTGTLFGKKAIRDALVEMLNCFYSMIYRVKTRGSDGVSTIISPATVTLGPLGGIVELDLTNISVGGSSGASVQQFKIVSDGGDYWVCKTWDGTTLGSSTVNVAKPYKLRAVNGPTSEAIRSVTYSYSYALTSGEYVRSTTATGVATTDYMTPSALTNDIIYAVTFSTATPATLAAVTWLDINVDGRAWAS
jgi:hypothetical protein